VLLFFLKIGTVNLNKCTKKAIHKTIFTLNQKTQNFAISITKNTRKMTQKEAFHFFILFV